LPPSFETSIKRRRGIKVKKGRTVGLEKWIGEVSRRMRAENRNLERRIFRLEERIDRFKR